MNVLVLRPQPGAGETAGRAIDRGLAPVAAPLFRVGPIDWDAPDPSDIEAVLLTSANAARQGGEQLGAFLALPVFAVGVATAAAARDAGFEDVRIGPSDGEALVAAMAEDGIVHALHLCGRDHVALRHPQIAITRRCVYAADAVDALPDDARRALGDNAVALLHSARAAALFARLIDAASLPRDTICIAAISEAAAAAAGDGWKARAIALEPRDEALLELAAKLCQTASREAGTDE